MLEEPARSIGPFPPAFDAATGYLLHASAPRATSEVGPAAPALTHSDWRVVVDLAAAHGVLGLVGAAVERAPDEVPDDVRRTLRASSRDAGARYLLFVSQLRRALGALEHGGVHALALKGPVLASVLDPSTPERRPCIDLDLLVRPRHVLAARDVLCGLGYTERLAFPRGHEERCVLAGKELVFDRPGHASLDLHWRLTLPFGPLGALEDTLWERAIRVRLEGTPVTTLCAEHHLLFLCIHGCGHGWGRLRWVVDVAAFLATHPSLDDAILVRTARETGSLHLLLAGVGVARNLLRAPLSEGLTQLLRTDPLARAAARWFADRLFAPDLPWARRAWVALLRQGLRNRLREGFGALLTPTDVEWSMMRLPPPLFGLYGGLRLARLLALEVGRVVGRSGESNTAS